MIDNFPEQEFPIYTNNLNVKINRANVDKDFIIFQIGTTNSFFKNNVLDISEEELKAFSVAYYRNNRWFALFLRDKNNYDDFKKAVQKKDPSATINLVNLLSTDFESYYAIKDVELIQLLVNTLKNNKTFEYNNITGSLYYQPDIVLNTESFELLNLRFFISGKEGIALAADFVSFTEWNLLSKYKKSVKKTHVFDFTTGEFRKAIKEDYGKKYLFFSEGVISKKGRKRRQFLNFNTYQQYISSKSGLIATFFEDVENNLFDYIQIEQTPILNYKAFDEPRIDYENTDYSAYLFNKKRDFSVVDTVNTTESSELQKLIIRQLNDEYKISKIITERSANNYIIEIIHEKDSDFYYTKKDERDQYLFPELARPDQHNLFTEDDIIQHVTVEKFKLSDSLTEQDDKKKKKIDKLNHDMMRNIIQELIIKGDIYDRQITIANWHEDKEWNFVCCGTGKWNNTKGCREYIYYKATVSTTGQITITTFDARNFPESEEWKIIDNIFRFYNKKQNLKYHPVECIIYYDLSKINVIYKTKQFTLPNLLKLTKDLKLSNKENEVLKNIIEKLINSFESSVGLETETEKNEFVKIKKNLKSEKKDKILLAKLLEGVRIQSISRFLDFCEQQDDIDSPFLLHARPKAGDNIYENFNSLLGLKVAKINGTYEYFVGKKKEALQYSLPSSCIIRSVIPWDIDSPKEKGGMIKK